jgi:hypothetical protein
VSGWGRGAPAGSGEARQGGKGSGEGLIVAAHGELGSPEKKNRNGREVRCLGRWAGRRRREMERTWVGKLVDRKTEAKRGRSVRATAAARCRVAGAWVEGENGVASAGRTRSEGVRAALELRATRGVKCSRRWRGAAGNSDGGAAAEEQSRGGHQRKKKRGGVRGTGLQITKIIGAYQ